MSRPISVLTTHSAWPLGSLVMGAHGMLSGAGSVIADWQVALLRAVQSGNLAEARKINDSIVPIVQAFYCPPFLDMHNRMKECLLMLGRVEKCHVRPPLVKLTAIEIEKLRRVLIETGLLTA